MLSIVLSVGAFADSLRIAALGDSLTQGYGLIDRDGFVPQLQRALDAKGYDVTMVNAGVSGDTTAGGLARVEWTLADNPDALIVALGGNDLLRGIAPEVSRANLAGILTVARKRDLPVLLVGMSATGNYGADYQNAFDAMYPELAAEFDTLLYPDFLAPLSAMPDRDATMKTYMQADHIHPNTAGVALVVEAILPEVEALIAEVASAP